MVVKENSLTFKNGKDVTDLSVPLLTQGGNDRHICQHKAHPNLQFTINCRERVLWPWDGQCRKPPATTRAAVVSSYLLPLFFIPGGNCTTLIARTLLIMKTHSLLNTASLHFNLDRVGFYLSRIYGVLILSLGCSLESPESRTPDKTHHKLRGETKVLVLCKGLQVSPMSAKHRTVP